MKPSPSRELALASFDAVLFDLDGVLTATARVHAAAWKSLFDSFLKKFAERTGEPFRPFEMEPDYRIHVDGKPRYEGVRGFLESRGIDLPFGDVSDAPDAETIHGLGKRKNRLFNQLLREQGVDVFDSSVRFVRSLIDADIRVAVVSSSKNCTTVLESAGILDLFPVRVDGIEAEKRNLAGKPQPDTFLAAARDLGVEPGRVIVVEDAISGVQAGRAGGFGLVIGIDRNDEAQALLNNGADVVVKSLSEISLVNHRGDTLP